MPLARPSPLTQGRLQEVLTYDPDSGEFSWRVDRNNYARAGRRTGTTNSHGYIVIRVDGRLYGAHRLAALYMLGELPLDGVDHKDRDRSNNKWSNLRLATQSQNSANTGILRNNTSGHRGVTWHKGAGKWMVQGWCHGVKYYLGLYTDLSEAAVAAQKWREENFKEFACPQPQETLSPTPEP